MNKKNRLKVVIKTVVQPALRTVDTTHRLKIKTVMQYYRLFLEKFDLTGFHVMHAHNLISVSTYTCGEACRKEGI